MPSHFREQARSRFAEAVSRDDEEIDLAEAALLIAAEQYPSLDVRAYLDKLDRFGDLAREQARKAGDAFDLLSAVNATLFEELGFHGNRKNYEDPRNSYLNEVIDRLTGIPITLSVIYIEVARRIGLTVHGVGMPMHFIVKYKSDNYEVFIDSFNGGRLMVEAGCKELLSEISGGRIELRPEQLASVSKKQILTRLLSNLLGIYAGSNDYQRALAVIDRILIINPDSLPHVRDRGLLLAALGETSGGRTELERYLALHPDAADANAIREQIKTIRRNQAKMN